MNNSKPIDQRNLILAVILSTLLVIVWQVLVEAPKRKELAKWHTMEQQKKELVQKREAAEHRQEEAVPATLAPAQRLALSPRIAITSGKLHGSIALKGLRFDDLRLARYRETVAPDSPEVTLLAPQGAPDGYFAQVGWLATDKGVQVPGDQSLWQADHRELTPGHPVTFHWENGQGLNFVVTASLDNDYMFTLAQKVENHAPAAVKLVPYGFINRAYADAGKYTAILHEGPLAVLDGTLSEMRYKALRTDGPKRFDNASGWLGITDKYWLTALVPDASGFKADVSYYQGHGQDRYQAEYSLPEVSVAPASVQENSTRFFAGAKELNVLDAYAQGNPPIPLFDRAVDFGMLYFLTKPMFLLLNFFYAHVGNFGIAIMLLTIVVKLCMFPLANKGYHAASQMRALQPEIQNLKESLGDDKARMQQELMKLYKREKVNPAAGCFPIVVQLPVFFALYKVFYVTIEMRQAPFFGWLHDLSMPDPSNLFTLFGLAPWPAPITLQVGMLPILMGITMALQMRLQPKPPDPTQAKVMQIMPYFMTFVLAKMPAGLVLYWTWSNTLSIAQQWVITRRYNAKHPDHPAK